MIYDNIYIYIYVCVYVYHNDSSFVGIIKEMSLRYKRHFTAEMMMIYLMMNTVQYSIMISRIDDIHAIIYGISLLFLSQLKVICLK